MRRVGLGVCEYLHWCSVLIVVDRVELVAGVCVRVCIRRELVYWPSDLRVLKKRVGGVFQLSASRVEIEVFSVEGDGWASDELWLHDSQWKGRDAMTTVESARHFGLLVVPRTDTGVAYA